MSNPPKPKWQKVDLRLPYGLRDDLNKYAAEQMRSTNEQIIYFIVQGMARSMTQEHRIESMDTKLDELLDRVRSQKK